MDQIRIVLVTPDRLPAPVMLVHHDLAERQAVLMVQHGADRMVPDRTILAPAIGNMV